MGPSAHTPISLQPPGRRLDHADHGANGPEVVLHTVSSLGLHGLVRAAHQAILRCRRSVRLGSLGSIRPSYTLGVFAARLSYGLYRYGLYSYGLYSHDVYIVMACIVVA